MAIEKEIGECLRARHLTMGTAESCTGGYIAHLITRVAGSSDYFCGGVVSYSNEVKHHVLGVSEESLVQYGAVSCPVVEQMALGAIRVLGCDCAVATSGIAGPGGGSPEKPVGTVWIAAALKTPGHSPVSFGWKPRIAERPVPVVVPACRLKMYINCRQPNYKGGYQNNKDDFCS